MSYKLNPITGKLDYYEATSSSGGITHATATGTDTYTATITGVTAYADANAYLIRFTNGNIGTATLNINGLGAKTLYRNNDGVLLGGDIWSGAEMLCVFNSTTDGFQCIGTTSNSLFSYVTNADSVTLTKGMPVYAFGGTGDRMTVKRANNSSDATSAQTVGLVLSTSIAANQKGIIMMQGLLDGLSILPTSTWSDGDPVYLGATDGSITNIKPSAPNHLVYLGVVTTASNGSAGRMYVRVQNGYELNELHDIKINSGTLANNDGLFYTSSTQLWENKPLTTALGFTPTTNARTISINGTSQDLSANRTYTVTDANLSTSDVTDNNVSTSKHGFVPKAPNDTSKFLRGDGTWAAATIADPAGWTYIVKASNHDVTNSATLIDDPELQFSVVAGGRYMIELDATISATNTTADYKNVLAVSAGTMKGQGLLTSQTVTGNPSISSILTNAAASSNTNSIGSALADIDGLLSIKIIYSFTASANAIFKYQFANNSAVAGAISRTWKGSILKYKRLD